MTPPACNGAVENGIDTMSRTRLNVPPLLTPGEVAALFRVDPKTVTRWAASGRLSSLRTPGGHRRFRADEVRRFLAGLLDEEDTGSPAP